MSSYVKNMGITMLNKRLEEKSLDPECPFIQAGVEDGDFLLAKSQAFTTTIIPKEGKQDEAIRTVMAEVYRAAEHGFTAGEYDRVRNEFLSQMEALYDNREKTQTGNYIQECVRHFLDNEAMPGIEMEYMLYKQATPQLPVEMTNQVIKGLVSLSDTNLVVLSVNPEKEGYVFTGWVDGYGNLLSTDSVYDLSYNEMYVTATFTVDSEIERPVRINEISAANDVFINEDFKKHDWIELYNATSAKIDVSGMYLSDDIDKPLKFSLPQGTTIPARGYLVIWCDKESGTQLHAPFKLDNKDGSAVVLTASDKSWADTLIYNTHTGFQSVGLYPNGGRYSYIMNRPSLGKANNSNSYDRFDRTIISGINVLLNTPKNEILYNLVGQPVTNPEPGQLYIKNGRKFFYKP